MSVSCRASALRFLKIRPRSIAELKAKLETKGFEANDVQETLEWLKNIDLLNDRTFTKSWIQYRLGRPFGFRRIIQELRLKGITPEIIDEEIAVFKEDTDEAKAALELARRRWSRFPALDPLKKKKRIFDFLCRRGFLPDVVMKVIKKL